MTNPTIYYERADHGPGVRNEGRVSILFGLDGKEIELWQEADGLWTFQVDGFMIGGDYHTAWQAIKENVEEKEGIRIRVILEGREAIIHQVTQGWVKVIADPNITKINSRFSSYRTLWEAFQKIFPG